MSGPQEIATLRGGGRSGKRGPRRAPSPRTLCGKPAWGAEKPPLFPGRSARATAALGLGLRFSRVKAEVRILVKVPKNLQCCRNLGPVLGPAVSVGSWRPHSEAPDPERLAGPRQDRRSPLAAARARGRPNPRAGGRTGLGEAARPSAAGPREAPRFSPRRPGEGCLAQGRDAPHAHLSAWPRRLWLSPHSCTEACARAWEATLELETPPPPQSAAGRPFCIPRPRGLGSGWLQVHAPSRLRSSHLAKSPLSSQGLEGARDLGESARLHAAARPRTNF